jgi:hypothetical protein
MQQENGMKITKCEKYHTDALKTDSILWYYQFWMHQKSNIEIAYN